MLFYISQCQTELSFLIVVSNRTVLSVYSVKQTCLVCLQCLTELSCLFVVVFCNSECLTELSCLFAVSNRTVLSDCSVKQNYLVCLQCLTELSCLFAVLRTQGQADGAIQQKLLHIHGAVAPQLLLQGRVWLLQVLRREYVQREHDCGSSAQQDLW